MAAIAARGVIVRTPGAPATVEELIVDPPGPGEVLVRILATGVCHTDLHAKLGNFAPDFPYLLGHEATGVVEAVGAGVTRPATGDTVVLSWRAPCGECRVCAAGRPTFCPRPATAKPRMRTKDGQTLGRVLGLGTFTTHTVVAAAQAIPVPADLRPEATSLIGCAVVTGVGSALYVAQLAHGSRVAVFGCGAVGMSVIQGARLAAATRIIAVDIVPRKLEWAKQFGATDVIDAREVDPVKRIRELTGGAGVDAAFEAIGLPQTLTQAMGACDVGGTCVLIGVPVPGTNFTLSLVKFFYTRGHLRSTFYGDCLPSRDVPLLCEWYRQGRLDLDGLVTRRIRLDEIEDAFGAMERGETLRSVIVPNS